MGQISSEFQNILPNLYSEFFHKDTNTLISKDISELDHEGFLYIINELNSLCRDFLDKERKQIIFAIRKGSDETLLWKSIVQIACVRINLDSNQVEICRKLTLEQLLKIFYTLRCHNAAMGQSEIHYEDFLSHLSEDSELSVQCIICFERRQELSLPCTHSFCSQCIEEWNEKHDTCPVCREKLESTDDTWVLSEKPNAADISKELELNIKELLERNDGPCVSF